MTTFPREMLGQHLAIVGKAGSGKTYAAKGLIEGLLSEHRRVCILDPTGVWWGLRSSASGTEAGHSIAVFGGMHGDVPIGAQSGAALARLLAGRNLPAIVDLSEMLIGERHTFVTDFAEALYRDNRQPLHLVIDEADEFCPQNPLPETKRMLHHVDRIVRRGRVRGFRVMLITQRPAVLHKNVLTQANTLVAMRLTAPQDRNAIKAWVDGQGDAEKGGGVLKSLAGMPRGEGWVWAPELDFLRRVPFPAIETFDSSRTPGDDETIEDPTTLAAVDLADVRAALEPKVEVEARLKRATPAVSEDDIQRRIDDALARQHAVLQEFIRAGAAAVNKTVLQIRAALDDLACHDVANVIEQATPKEAARAIVKDSTARHGRRHNGADNPTPWVNPDDYGDDEDPPVHLLAPAQRIVDAIAWWGAAGIQAPTRHQVAFVAGYTVSGHFNNTLGKLNGEGFIHYPASSCVGLTEKGRAHAKQPEQGHATFGHLCQAVDNVLQGEPQRRLFGVVANHGAISREGLAQRTGYTVSGHFNNTLGALNRLGVIRYPAPGQVALGAMFDALR